MFRKSRCREPLRFLEKTALKLPLEAPRDAIAQGRPRPAQAEDERLKRLTRPFPAERADGAPRQLEDLERAHDAHRVPRKDSRERLGIDPLQLPAERVQALLADSTRQPRADCVVARRSFEQALERGADVEPGASRDDGKVPTGLDFQNGSPRFASITPGAVGFGGLEERNEVVRDPRAISLGWSASPRRFSPMLSRRPARCDADFGTP